MSAVLRLPVRYLRLLASIWADRDAAVRRIVVTTIAALALSLVAAVAFADPPGRIGRVSAIEGEAVLQGPEGDPFRAEINWPVTSGFNLQTAPNARAEVRIGSVALRLDGDTTARFAAVDDTNVALVLDRGTLALRLRARDTVAEVSVHTPEGRVTFADVGRYRIDVGRVPGTTVVSADRGFARIIAPDLAVDVRSGRAVEIAAGTARFVTTLTDAFDDWTLARDRRDDAIAQGYVSPEMTGYEDLAHYGDWRTTAGYGAVWVPRAVPVGWTPYRHGRWQWIAPWGWTWIDDAPWGFAPFHYGRWCYLDGVWGWAPGAWVARPYYAPALVGWIGRPGWSVSFAARGFVGAGWFPLAPRETFVPWYRTSPVYVQNINIAHVTKITHITHPQGGSMGAPQGGMGAGITEGTAALGGMGATGFANARLPNAVTVAPAAAIAQGQRIGGSALNVPAGQLAGAQPVAPIAPQAGAVRGGTAGLGGMGAAGVPLDAPSLGGRARGAPLDASVPGDWRGTAASGAATALAPNIAPRSGASTAIGGAPGAAGGMGGGNAGPFAGPAGAAPNAPPGAPWPAGNLGAPATRLSVPPTSDALSGTRGTLGGMAPRASESPGAAAQTDGMLRSPGGMGGSIGGSIVPGPRSAIAGSSPLGGAGAPAGNSAAGRPATPPASAPPPMGTFGMGAIGGVAPPGRQLSPPVATAPRWSGPAGTAGGGAGFGGMAGTSPPSRIMPPAPIAPVPAAPPPRASYAPPAPSFAPPPHAGYAAPRVYAPPAYAPPAQAAPPAAMRAPPPPSSFGGMGGMGGAPGMGAPRGMTPPTAPAAPSPAPQGNPRGPGGGFGGMGGRG
jgi:hypothetical protein